MEYNATVTASSSESQSLQDCAQPQACHTHELNKQILQNAVLATKKKCAKRRSEGKENGEPPSYSVEIPIVKYFPV